MYNFTYRQFSIQNIFPCLLEQGCKNTIFRMSQIFQFKKAFIVTNDGKVYFSGNTCITISYFYFENCGTLKERSFLVKRKYHNDTLSVFSSYDLTSGTFSGIETEYGAFTKNGFWSWMSLISIKILAVDDNAGTPESSALITMSQEDRASKSKGLFRVTNPIQLPGDCNWAFTSKVSQAQKMKKKCLVLILIRAF